MALASSASAADSNPWDFYLQVAATLVNRPPSPGFRGRLIVLLVFIFCVSLASIVYLALTLVDYRQRGRKIWLWRLVDRQSGRLIVGNQQLLEPLLTLNTSCVLAGFVITEYRVYILNADQRWTDAWQVVPWTAVFVQSWIVSWASLQAFIVSLGDRKWTLCWCQSTVANVVFLGGGVAQVGVLLTFDSLSATSGRHLWDQYVTFQQFVEKEAAGWTSTGPVDEAALNQMYSLLTKLSVGAQASINVGYEVISFFILSTFLIGLVNLGGIALIVAVRRQIKISSGELRNFRTFGSMILSRIISQAPPPPTLSGPDTVDSDSTGGVEVLSSSPPAVPELSLVPTAISTVISLPPRVEPVSTSHEEPSSKGASMSRAVVRELAMQLDIEGGARKEHAKNLMALQRAEVDLFVMSLSVLFIMFSVGIIMVWTVTVLPRLSSMPFFATEAVLFLGAWIYSIFSGLALCIHCWTSWVHLPARRSDPPRSGSENVSRGGEEEDRGWRDPFEDVLRQGPDGGREDGSAGGNTGTGDRAMATAIELAPWPAEDKGRAEKEEEKEKQGVD